MHCAPEAAAGGPIALVADGDEIAFDLPAGTIQWRVSDEEQTARRAAYVPRPISHDRRYLAEFAATVTGADRGVRGQGVGLHPVPHRAEG